MLLHHYITTGSNGEECTGFYFPLENNVPLDASRPFTEVRHEGTVRKLSTFILTKAVDFNDQLDRLHKELSHQELVALGQNCGLFAVACQTGETFGTERFTGSGNRSVQVKWSRAEEMLLADGHAAPATEVGDALLLMHGDKSGRGIVNEKTHVIVRVSAEDGFPPLYASKRGPTGEVFIHDLPAACRRYQSKVIVPVQPYIKDAEFTVTPKQG
jgi:hypothetical protein